MFPIMLQRLANLRICLHEHKWRHYRVTLILNAYLPTIFAIPNFINIIFDYSKLLDLFSLILLSLYFKNEPITFIDSLPPYHWSQKLTQIASTHHPLTRQRQPRLLLCQPLHRHAPSRTIRHRRHRQWTARHAMQQMLELWL